MILWNVLIFLFISSETIMSRQGHDTTNLQNWQVGLGTYSRTKPERREELVFSGNQ